MTDPITSVTNNNWKPLNDFKRQLSDDERRFLEYFWNKQKQEIRWRLPFEIICFFEMESYDESMRGLIDAKTNAALYELELKNYLKSANKVYSLTQLGVEYLKDQHPRLIVLWKRFLETTPASVSLLVAAIGFVASVFGIYDFVEKYILGR